MSSDPAYRNPAAENARATPPALSVILPTFRRPASLLRVLETLSAQTGIARSDVEVVVADDGSGDSTTADVRAWAGPASLRLLLSPSAENRGPAHARNRAIALASAPVLLITGDDILAPPHFLSQHATWHRDHPAAEDALLGRVEWAPDPPPTPFMQWLATGGRAFFFAYPDRSGPVPADKFYTCNVSLKRSLLVAGGGFDESFRHASHEDLELGLRLAHRCGLRLHFEPDVTAWHDHRLTVASSLRRVYLMGYSSVVFWQKAPFQSASHVRLLRRLFCTAASVSVFRKAFQRLKPVAERRTQAPILWRALLTAAYWLGASDGQRGRPANP